MNPSLLLFNLLAQPAETPPATEPATQPVPPPLPPPTNDPPKAATSLSNEISHLFHETTFVNWLVFVVFVILGIAAGRFIKTALRAAGDRLKQRGWTVRGAIFHHAAGPSTLAMLAVGLTLAATSIKLTERLREDFSRAILLLYVIAIAWFLYNLVELIDYALRKVTAGTTAKIDDTVVTLLRKILRVFLLIMFVLYVLQNVFDQQITAWLAGLGIAGLAVSLAAQDSIKNLFGSLTVLISRPFGLGDRIVFGTYDGTVENINFRDTKIRTIGGHLVTVPNMKFTDQTVENIAARPYVARTINLGLTYDTPPDKIEQAMSIIKGILAEPKCAESINLPDRPPRVYFTDFTAHSLNIMVNYHYSIKAPGCDWWTYQDHAQAINLKILRSLNDAGIDFAFQTQTVYLAGDPKRDLSVRLLEDASGQQRPPT